MALKFEYCQRHIETGTCCETQCDHCKEYYTPLKNSSMTKANSNRNCQEWAELMQNVEQIEDMGSNDALRYNVIIETNNCFIDEYVDGEKTTTVVKVVDAANKLDAVSQAVSEFFENYYEQALKWVHPMKAAIATINTEMANGVSSNSVTAKEYLESQGVDTKELVSKGMNRIKKAQKKKP